MDLPADENRYRRAKRSARQLIDGGGVGRHDGDVELHAARAELVGGPDGEVPRQRSRYGHPRDDGALAGERGAGRSERQAPVDRRGSLKTTAQSDMHGT